MSQDSRRWSQEFTGQLVHVRCQQLKCWLQIIRGQVAPPPHLLGLICSLDPTFAMGKKAYARDLPSIFL